MKVIFEVSTADEAAQAIKMLGTMLDLPRAKEPTAPKGETTNIPNATVAIKEVFSGDAETTVNPNHGKDTTSEKTKRRRKSAEQPAGPVPPAPEPKPEPSADVFAGDPVEVQQATEADAKAALNAVFDSKGLEAAMGALARVGAKRFADVQADSYAKLIAACKDA